MKYSIETLPSFDKQFKRLTKKYKSLKEDLRKLAEILKHNPATGADLEHSVRKVRLAIASKDLGE